MQSNQIRTGKSMAATLGQVLAVAALLGATGCGGQSAAERTTLGEEIGAPDELPVPLQLQLDSGNAAYIDRQYDAALRHFDSAVRLDPDLAAGWYGVGMTHGAMGNSAAADSAMARVHLLAPDLPLQHPVAVAPPNPHPVQPESRPEAP
jgi:tetratricopeptide (TPR) repeat protein